MKMTITLFVAMLAAMPASAGEFFSSHRGGGSSQEVAVGSVEIKGRGVVNLVAVLEFVRPPNDPKTYKSDAYSDFLNRVEVGAKAVVLKVLLEKPSIELAEIKTIRENMDKALSEYLELEIQKAFPAEKLNVAYGITMLYVSDPFECRN